MEASMTDPFPPDGQATLPQEVKPEQPTEPFGPPSENPETNDAGTAPGAETVAWMERFLGVNPAEPGAGVEATRPAGGEREENTPTRSESVTAAAPPPVA